MAASFCAHCGKPVPAGSGFCPSCGAATGAAASAGGPAGYVAGAGPPSPSPGPLPGGAYAARAYPGGPYPGGTWGGFDPAAASRERAANAQGLRRVQLAAVVALVGTILGFAAVAIENLSSFLTVSATTGGPVLSLSVTAAIGTYLGVALVLGLIGFWLYASAFRAFRPFSSEFSTPATLAMLAVVGTVLVGVGLGLFLVALVQAIHCVGSGNPITTGCLFTGTFWGGIALLIIGAVVVLVGYIGILIGIWRVGSRFDNSLFKVGAVLLIIPYVSLVGTILILIGATQERGKLR